MTAVYTLLPDLQGLVLPDDAPRPSKHILPQTMSLLLMLPHSEDTALESHIQYPCLGDFHQRLLVPFLPDTF